MNGNLKPGRMDIQEKRNAGINFEEQHKSCLTKFQQSSLKEEPCNPSFGLVVPYTSPGEANGQIGISDTHLRPSPQPSPAKQFDNALQSWLDSSSETQIRNGRPQADGRGKNNLFPRYWPKFTDQDLQQITGDSNSIITPLFEKICKC
ncbi:B3 domain-containing protein Os07g0563300-like [Hibiscus syriacus]|uniref:B3 domain-containing protein Os07g0563300-like n=1 Tax=Hibiscus syriacus TaxID=106335 RepID=UPI001924610C|nr:B3 domain-containing protein Os07g0563300-like [Hibiscus syriacus]